MGNRLVIYKGGKHLVSVSFELDSLPHTCSQKVLSYLSVVIPFKVVLTEEEWEYIFKIVANYAFTKAVVGDTCRSHLDFKNIRKRIILTSDEDGGRWGYATGKMIKTLGLKIGPSCPGGHGDYRMILGVLDEDRHSSYEIPSEYEVKEDE